MTHSHSVLVTGASTGIGLHLVRCLAARECRVYATARRADDLRRLRAIEGVSALAMDVRCPEEIERARGVIAAAGRGLHGLINNAGVGGIGPLATFGNDDLRDLFEVNVFGPHRVTNAMLELLRTTRGRIVNIGSQGGSIASRDYGPYAMTKHALEAYTASLREELAPHGIAVSIVQPGAIRSRIAENALPSTLARLQAAPRWCRSEAWQLATRLQSPPAPDPAAPESNTNRRVADPESVAVAVLDALESSSPRARYLVGSRWEGNRVIDTLLERLLDANDCPTLSYDRDELVARLDRHVAARSGGDGGQARVSK
ncbi:MAG: SDR family NAD(P)-dependent oxidoreductase [Phycisphaerales bacterium]|nr:SDR family NAD(P)-dependent oxidoreductase [Phycisphaerales bacterium]